MNHSPDKTPPTLLMIGVEQIGDCIGNMVEQSGYAVMRVANARDAVSYISRGKASVVLIDLTTGRATLELADILLGLPDCPPIVILDREPSIEQMRSAMRMGIADCLFLSEGDRQIAERLTALLARVQPKANTTSGQDKQEKENNADLELNISRRILTIGKVPITLSPIENSLMELLIQHAPSMVTYEEIAKVAFTNTTSQEQVCKSLRPHIARLRQKIETSSDGRWRIVNLRRQGYALKRVGISMAPHATMADDAVDTATYPIARSRPPATFVTLSNAKTTS